MKTIMKIAALSTALTPVAALAQDDEINIAYLASSSQNGFNQAIYEGIQKAAEAYGNVSVEIFDGEFSAPTQFTQVEDLVAGGRFDAMIVTPNDTVGIATALEDATAAGMTVAATLFPIGPDLQDMEPQVDGLVTTVASDPSIGAARQAEEVVAFCEDKDPCKVVVLIGQLVFPFDNLRYETFQSVLGEHDNIEIVATGEGNYSPETSLTAMQDILQANPDVDAVLSNADQHLMGAEIAIVDAGLDLESIYLIGGGLNQIAADAIRAGSWDASLAQFPVSMGSAALDAVVDSLNGEEVETWIDESKLGDSPAVVTKEWLDENPDFEAEWQG
ncbi:sugar ABC transporter substrate-binding protein [Pelagovum pacificum]|uniref:Sugar ABC transporter substrate-binding protein n=1 Tax=Pelagovum pacificum TaxID=2588711 RepID=A0A5C5GEX2_9RHOB|nr:sugar ABC transporter substrate-binding protein [Pelagovum pacificum]QQA43567.1 sugar ABC transporter substrate-binding protein [Pelagovum pacificum]TNY33295.1 sugar ABC transporter substrate-binding protein [Pelagovum pacificum]